MDATPPPKRRSLRQWFGPAGFVTLAVFVLGRLALEPLRRVPHFDDKGMEAFDAVRVYSLERRPEPFRVAVLGSSITLWGVIEQDLAAHLGLPAAEVRKLATAGGSVFDMWNMVRFNPQRFEGIDLAVVEINPFILQAGLDDDPRIRFTISQHATLEERWLIDGRAERRTQIAEWFLPLQSVRRNARSAFLDAIDPDPGWIFYPAADSRCRPTGSWFVSPTRPPKVTRPDRTGRRLFDEWEVSKLQDRSLHELHAWFAARGIAVVHHQLPLHPAVAKVIRRTPDVARGHRAYNRYLDALRVKPAAFIRTLDAEDVGVPLEGMRDTTHFNRIGAGIYTKHLATELRPVVDSVVKSPPPAAETAR